MAATSSPWSFRILPVSLHLKLNIVVLSKCGAMLSTRLYHTVLSHILYRLPWNSLSSVKIFSSSPRLIYISHKATFSYNESSWFFVSISHASTASCASSTQRKSRSCSTISELTYDTNAPILGFISISFDCASSNSASRKGLLLTFISEQSSGASSFWPGSRLVWTIL